MRKKGGYLTYLTSASISKVEQDLIAGYVEYRNTLKPTSERTKGKQAYEAVWICKVLHQHNTTLDTCTLEDLLKVAGESSDGSCEKNTRQTKIVTLKAVAKYINRFHKPIENLRDLLEDVKAGGLSKKRKEVLNLDEWDRLINHPMSARDRAILAVLYDGYHRPKEILLLKWSDLRTNERGDIEYDITFKTEYPRTIVQKPGTTEILEAWRRECGANLSDHKPIFPSPTGNFYETITTLKDLFDRLKIETGLPGLKPSMLRNTAITHDVNARQSIPYICLRAWGEPYNELINLYSKPDSGKIQRDQHDQNGVATAVLGKSAKFSTKDDRITEMERELVKMRRELAIIARATNLAAKSEG
jgi:integrase